MSNTRKSRLLDDLSALLGLQRRSDRFNEGGRIIPYVYSALILVDDVAVTDEKISTILKAANVEPYWRALFAKALEGINVKDLITNIGS
ncbi:AAEL009472-PA [Aedes aegypti]|uniref:Large ribosomal subunit protein P1 n=1 Tax=Aedes aegypti TaxID=7159 RepID=Q16VR0_AEDAE|nr:AAEL009472-PA [Aedes aegypti]